ncbi:hypothetical protein P7K49_028654 [Saguinus oedipus]|uniref:Uncharacterized protein n=1 Tax=Saguinus oedipus TaxID=9490 RepID=A0ABQ9U517_SAGOE|nr:hypothetical protein P7K49_028654 [Saguinus oedipus]
MDHSHTWHTEEGAEEEEEKMQNGKDRGLESCWPIGAGVAKRGRSLESQGARNLSAKTLKLLRKKLGEEEEYSADSEIIL